MQPSMDLGLTVDIQRRCDELTLIDELIDLDGKDILELGCGRAVLTRAIASAGQDRRVTALEVDRVQHGLNLEIRDLPNVRFALGGAEAIPAADSSVDVAFLFKSLHHVPEESMDQALRELARVLRPGGHALITEPIFRGPLNEVLRIFHDESRVRRAAFDAIVRAVDGGSLELVVETFLLSPRSFGSFADFERLVLGATHTDFALSPEQLAATRRTFEGYAKENGGHFESAVRVDLLRRPA